MIKLKNTKLLTVLLCGLLVSLSGCNDEIREQNRKDKIKFNELHSFHSKPLSELTCENIDRQYERCGEYNLYVRIEHCQKKYTPVLMRCYGVKAN